MPPVVDWKDIVQASWESIKGKVATDLPKAVQGKGLSDQVYKQELGVCVSLNGPNTAGVWNDNGPGTVEVKSLRVSDFTSVAAGSARFGNLDVQLPLTFALLQASGRYAYGQPCALYNFGKKGPFLDLHGAGELNARMESGTLIFNMKVIDPDSNLRLELTGATVDGQRSVNIKADGTPDNGILRWLVEVLGRGFAQNQFIKAALDSLFAHDQFSRDLVNELNRIIGGVLTERAQG